MDVDWQADLDRFLMPFVAALRHKTRARMCPAYIAGLIGPGDRKSVQPMATRAGEVSYDQLHHFVAAGVWDSAPLEAALLKKADDLVGCEIAPNSDPLQIPSGQSHLEYLASAWACTGLIEGLRLELCRLKGVCRPRIWLRDQDTRLPIRFMCQENSKCDSPGFTPTLEREIPYD